MKIKPKIPFDEDVLAKVNAFYYVNLDEKYLGLECFSDPQLDSHICNPQAQLENEQPCKYCDNVAGRKCKITCHLNYYCLAAFAYRLGVGDPSGKTKFQKAMKHNLKEISYDKLYLLVESLRKQDPENLEPPVDEAQTEIELDVKPKPKLRRRKAGEGSVIAPDGVELITIKDAAELYGCSYVTMHGYMRHGKIPRVEYEGSVFVRKADVVAYKAEREAEDA